ncbi:hypothetical protein ACFFJI_03435 [Allobacillus sp. GCM10007491]|uniref:Uncharacterized protein n=2 Tax=Allobacillus TaxID=1400133 RepID=A0A941CTI6_9BACI|nr:MULTISPECIES: hypothetical protein [Allobacillus]MBR7553663.1 hypothetical protein [Allobacillus saliphilus]TSJ65062.1 hypothetical protein FPQ13_08005 [Allobacillus salarius]
MVIHGNPTYWTPVFRQQNSNHQYPEVQPQAFQTSASQMARLIEEAGRLTTSIFDSESHARAIMGAAQKNDHKTVVSLLDQSLDFSVSSVTYTPTGLKVQLNAKEEMERGSLTLQYIWE